MIELKKQKKRYATQINHPYDWSQLIRFAGKEKFNVIETEQSNFQDFHSLLKIKYQFKKKMRQDKYFFFVLYNGYDITKLIKILCFTNHL
jgi:hypothetical protein